ncbi:MAG: pyrimidine-nucleoside phosphorylase, partial [Oscillospiraceae bacterium]|nr:pyrimidine-nucleoside phosphorylase [Oscillospiraceae bacterium]
LAPCSRTLTAASAGWSSALQSETIGRASVLRGAGRMTKNDSIDFGAGIRLHVKYGDAVSKGDPLLTMYAAKESQLDEAEQMLKQAVTIAENKPETRPLIRNMYSTADE